MSTSPSYPVGKYLSYRSRAEKPSLRRKSCRLPCTLPCNLLPTRHLRGWQGATNSLFLRAAAGGANGGAVSSFVMMIVAVLAANRKERLFRQPPPPPPALVYPRA